VLWDQRTAAAANSSKSRFAIPQISSPEPEGRSSGKIGQRDDRADQQHEKIKFHYPVRGLGWLAPQEEMPLGQDALLKI
jgi:hypothetical protein